MDRLSLSTVPCLIAAFTVLDSINDAIKQVKVSKHQLQALGNAAAQFLETLNTEYKAGRISEASTSRHLKRLDEVLRDILTFVQKQGSCSFLRSLYTKNERIAKIDSHHKQLVFAVQAFQMAALINIKDWQRQNDTARSSDQTSLHQDLQDLKTNQNVLLEKLAAKRENLDAMIISIHHHLTQNSNQDVETQFLRETIKYMETASGRIVPVKRWTITSFDVEFEEKLSSGDIGEVWRGNWHGTQVALKMLKKDGVVLGSDSITREIDVWSALAHPHVLEFFGANVLDDKPFIVMPYYHNGNARDYTQRNPDCDRMKILYDISLGLVYLHSQRITHGGLKAMNVLIGGDERAVLSDFGLSEFGRNANPRATKDFIIGSRFWMSPERFSSTPAQPPSDIYAFGMTAFEIYTNETPLSDINVSNFIERVTHGARPKRPQGDTAIPDEIWDLAVTCWAHEPSERPTARTVRDKVNSVFHLTSVEKRKTLQGTMLDEIRILRQDTAELREMGEAKDQELEGLRRDIEEARRYADLKDRELLQLRAELSLVTQRHNLCTQAAEEAHIQEETKDREVQRLREPLSKVKKHSTRRYIGATAGKWLFGPSKTQMPVTGHSQSSPTSRTQTLESEPNLPVGNSLVQEEDQPAGLGDLGPMPAPTPPQTIRRITEDGESTKSEPHSKYKSDLSQVARRLATLTTKDEDVQGDDVTNPRVPLPDPAEDFWTSNPWNDNYGYEGPSEEAPHDRLGATKGSTGADEDRGPDHREIANIKTNDDYIAGSARNLLGQPTSQEDQSKGLGDVVPPVVLAPTPKAVKLTAETDKPNKNGRGEPGGLQFDLFKRSQPSNLNPVASVLLPQPSPHIRPQSVPPSGDLPISTHISALPPRPMTANPTKTRDATAGFTQSSATLFPSSDISAVLSHSDVWSSHVPGQHASLSGDMTIPIKLSTSTVPSSDANAALFKTSSQGHSNMAVPLPRQNSAFASLQTDPNSRFMQPSQQTANGAGNLPSSGTEPGSSGKFKPYAPIMRHSQTEPYSIHRSQPHPQPLSGVGPSSSDSSFATFRGPMDESDDESTPSIPNVTLTPSKTASTDRGVYSYSQPLPTTGFKEDAGLFGSGWRG